MTLPWAGDLDGGGYGDGGFDGTVADGSYIGRMRDAPSEGWGGDVGYYIGRCFLDGIDSDVLALWTLLPNLEVSVIAALHLATARVIRIEEPFERAETPWDSRAPVAAQEALAMLARQESGDEPTRMEWSAWEYAVMREVKEPACWHLDFD